MKIRLTLTQRRLYRAAIALVIVVAFQNCSKLAGPNASTDAQLLSSPPANSLQVSPTFCPYDQLTGTTPNDTCIQNAINAACSLADSPTTNIAGELVFANAQYYIKYGVSIPKSCSGLKLKGQGFGKVPASTSGTFIISDNNCTGPIINFYGDATQNYVAGGGVSDIGFFNSILSGGSSSGATSCPHPLIQANHGQLMEFNHLYAWQPIIFLKLVGGLHYVIDDVYLDQAVQDSTGLFEFTGSGANPDPNAQGTRQDEIIMSSVMSFGSIPQPGHKMPNGIWWHGFSSSLQTNNTVFEFSNTALKVDCTEPGVPAEQQAAQIGSCPAYGVFHDFETEGAGSNLLDITDAQALNFYYLYAACFAASPYGGCNNNVHVYNSKFTDTSAISIYGGQINGAQASCLDYSAAQLMVQGTHFFGCNTANVGGSDITLEPPTGSNISGMASITGNIFCDGYNNNSIHEDAINSIAGNDYVVITGNTFYNCAAGVIGSVGTHGVETLNAGP